MNKIFIYFFALISSAGCTESIVENVESVDAITVNIRMEVQILDSLNHLYSRPFTKIYFTTYKLNGDGSQSDYEQSDTTSYPNGWGVKEMVFILSAEDEKIMLGAACESYNGPNLRFEEITYTQAAYRADSNSVANIIRTFAIYYN